MKKENGSFGMVIRGGYHDHPRRRRPFTVVHIQKGTARRPDGSPGQNKYPVFQDGTIRVNDRVRAINGVSLAEMRLPELQSLLYQQGKVIYKHLKSSLVHQ